MISLHGPRIRTLDGWRGIAILLVIVGHVASYTVYQDRFVAYVAGFGVDIFFVISGYIITLRFLQERERSSTINLRSFYLRRVFRILPLVVVYLSVLSFVSLFINLEDFHYPQVLGSLFFYRNYQYAANPVGIYTAHFWSLSVEEHFYLIWPALLLWLGTRRSLWLAVIGAICCASWRFYDITHPNCWLGRMLPHTAGVLWRTDTRFDGLLLGCAVAILLANPSVKNFIYCNFPKETPLFVAILLVFNLSRTFASPELSTYLLVCIILASTLIVQEGLAYKFLNSRLLVWIGTISYSVYIWQQLFLVRPGMNILPFGILSSLPLNIICVFAISAMSFNFIERPCVALGKHLCGMKQVSQEVSSSTPAMSPSAH